MRVRDFMKTDVISAGPGTLLMDALNTMKQKKIKRLPVLKNGRLIGLVTRSMIRDASPSQATSLSVYELNYLISKMTVADVMVKEPMTISPDMPVEEAIWLGQAHGIGAFPIVENNALIGIITESDISGVVSSALGLNEKNSQRITIHARGKRFGFLKELVEVMDAHKIPIMSIMSVPKTSEGDWYLILRVRTGDVDTAAGDLKEKGFDVLDVT